MENMIPSIARGQSSAGMGACGKRRQPDASPTRMSAINPPRNNAASIHSAKGGRLRIRPRGGSFCRANSSESASLSSARRRSSASEAGAPEGSCGSSLNSRGTLTMLAPKKSGRQANARPSESFQRNLARFSQQSCGRKNFGVRKSRVSAPKFPPASMPRLRPLGLPVLPNGPAADAIPAGQASESRGPDREEFLHRPRAAPQRELP